MQAAECAASQPGADGTGDSTRLAAIYRSTNVSRPPESAVATPLCRRSPKLSLFDHDHREKGKNRDFKRFSRKNRHFYDCRGHLHDCRGRLDNRGGHVCYRRGHPDNR